MIAVNPIIGTGEARLTTSDQSFQAQHRLIVETTFLLILQESFHTLIAVLDHFIRAVGEDLVEAIDEMHET